MLTARCLLWPRRVYGQVVATKSVFESTIENADVIVEAVNNARADVIEKGRTYEEDDVLVLKQSASGAITSPTPLDEYVADIYGNITSIGKNTIDLQDTIDRSRPRPTAYIVDASEPWVDDLLYILKHHNTEYFELEKELRSKFSSTTLLRMTVQKVVSRICVHLKLWSLKTVQL